MSKIKIMSAKLHRVRVTGADKDYMGSITIDEDLLEMVGILPLEEVEVVNLNSGKRWSTYVLPGKRGSGDVCPNGGGALLCNVDDILLVFSYVYVDRDEVMGGGHKAQVVIADAENRCQERFSQELTPQENGKVVFSSCSLKF